MEALKLKSFYVIGLVALQLAASQAVPQVIVFHLKSLNDGGGLKWILSFQDWLLCAWILMILSNLLYLAESELHFSNQRWSWWQVGPLRALPTWPNSRWFLSQAWLWPFRRRNWHQWNTAALHWWSILRRSNHHFSFFWVSNIRLYEVLSIKIIFIMHFYYYEQSGGLVSSTWLHRLSRPGGFSYSRPTSGGRDRRNRQDGYEQYRIQVRQRRNFTRARNRHRGVGRLQWHLPKRNLWTRNQSSARGRSVHGWHNFKWCAVFVLLSRYLITGNIKIMWMNTWASENVLPLKCVRQSSWV